MFKVLFRLTLRISTGFVQSLIKMCSLDWTAPDYSTLCTRQKILRLQLVIKKKQSWTARPVDFTGLKFPGEAKWKRKKYYPE